MAKILFLSEFSRYIINGLFATGVHYVIFIFNLKYISINSAGLANFLASFVGISVSFMGNRYFVFQGHHRSILPQFFRFSALYASVAIFNGLSLFIMSDKLSMDRNLGFLLTVCVQVCITYIASRRVVFA